MLEKLDEIGWSSLQHAYGEASDVPGQIRALISDDETERNKAFYELCGNIYHQGTLYEATVSAIPFLLEIYNFQKAPNHEQIVLLVALIASGKGCYSKLGITESIRKLIRPYLPSLISYLRHEESHLRQASFLALIPYVAEEPDYRSLLEEALAAETEEENIEIFRGALDDLKEEDSDG